MTELVAISEDSREEMRKRGAKIGCCPCCSRTVPLTFHHLVPKKVHRRNRYKKQYSKNDLNRGIYLCRRCHKGIHRTFDEPTLAEKFNSLETILSNERLAKHFRWVAKRREIWE